MKKVFLDANVVLDFLDGSRVLHDNTKKLFEVLIDRNCLIVISEDILATIYYFVKNKQAVLDWYEQVLDQWEIVSFGTEMITEAVTLCKNGPAHDFEDVLQSLSAKKSDCDVIITNDKDFYQCGVPCMGTIEYLDHGIRPNSSPA